MVTLSRRAIIAGGLGAAGIAVLGIAAATSMGPGAQELSAAKTGIDLVRSRFSPFVGETFTAHSGAVSFPLVLEAVEDLAPVQSPAEERRFNLLFSASGSEPPQGIYTVRNPNTPDAWLFMSPIGQDGPARRIQALIDRSV